MNIARRAASAAVILLALLLSSATAATSTVAAQAPAEDARALFARGQTAYRQGDYEAAIAAWNSAYAQDPRPLLQYNLSQAYERLGRLLDAKTALERYVAEAEATDTNQADARARLSSLRERLTRTGVRVSGGPEGATILIDGEDKGRTPRPDAISVAPGSHRIVVRLAGYDDFNATLVVPAGEAVQVEVEMIATSHINNSLHNGGAAGPQRGADVSSGSPLPAILLIGGGGVAAIGLGLGIVAFSMAGSATSSEGSDADTARTLALVADIGMGVGLLAAAFGLVLLLTGGDDEDAAPQASTARLRVGPIVTPTVAGASATLSF